MFRLIVYSMRVSMPTLILLSNSGVLLENVCALEESLTISKYHLLNLKMEI